MTKHDPYFTPIDDDSTFTVPDTISDVEVRTEEDYLYLPKEIENRSKFKWLFFAVIGLISSLITWEVYTTLVELFKFNVVFYMLFIVLILLISVLASIEAYQFYKGQQKLKHIDKMREQADNFIRERSHGKSTLFIIELKQLYSESPQGKLLQHVISNQPDYLNDAEIITYLSENFFSHLDKEAQHIISSESIKIGTIIALSPLAIVDTLVVLWRTMRMVNQINGIYGLSLTRIAQWKVFIKIVKATLLAASSEVAISGIVDKAAEGVAGAVTGSLAQGVGIGIYATRVGIESMKNIRPIAFTEENLTKINSIMNIFKNG